jgi:hypothetical protein
VLAHFVLSIVALLACSAPGIYWWEGVFIFYGVIRVLEVVVSYVDWALFFPDRAEREGSSAGVLSYRVMVVNSLQNYAETIFWFALFYRNCEWAFSGGGATLNSLVVSLNLSFATMTTFGSTGVSAQAAAGIALTLTQAVIGFSMTVIILAIILSGLRLPKEAGNHGGEKDPTDWHR